MTRHRYCNMTLPIALGIFLSANLALANHHEEQQAGEVDIEKIEQHKAMHKEKRAQVRDHRGQHSAMRMHDRLDTNEDGKVDLNEFLSHAESRFHEMDTDSDQFVTDEEAKQHHKNMRKKQKVMKKKHKQHTKDEVDKEADK